MNIQEEANEDFFFWFKEETEKVWHNYQPSKALGTFYPGWPGAWESEWQPETKWGRGLSEEEIIAVEERLHLRFPPDHRLFLRLLHCPDRPMLCAEYDEEGQAHFSECPPFFVNWLDDGIVEMMESRRQMQLEGVLFDVEKNSDWLPSWGERPATREERKQRVQHHFAHNPPLIPLAITQNNYLPSEPLESGNPVLTLKQSEVILFYADLRAFLVHFLWSLAGGEENDPLYVPLGYGHFRDKEQQERVRISQPFWYALWMYWHR